ERPRLAGTQVAGIAGPRQTAPPPVSAERRGCRLRAAADIRCRGCESAGRAAPESRMNRQRTLSRRVGEALLRASEALLPERRRVWAKAMRGEYEHFTNDQYLTDRQALAWAAGCLLVSLKERMAMIKGNFKISRWLLAPEMLLCFLPLTLLWL